MAPAGDPGQAGAGVGGVHRRLRQPCRVPQGGQDLERRDVQEQQRVRRGQVRTNFGLTKIFYKKNLIKKWHVFSVGKKHYLLYIPDQVMHFKVALFNL